MEDDLKIIIAEDEAVQAVFFKAMIKKIGFDAEVAKDGAELLKKLAEKNYDLIIMDLQMPVMDGYEATFEIRSKRKSDIPIIAVSALNLPEDIEKCFLVGMNSFVSKPINPSELQKAINDIFLKK